MKSDNVDMVIPEIKGAYDQPRKLVSSLRSRILGFLVVQKDEFSMQSGQIAPKLNAFQAFQDALEYFQVDDVTCRNYLEKPSK